MERERLAKAENKLSHENVKLKKKYQDLKEKRKADCRKHLKKLEELEKSDKIVFDFQIQNRHLSSLLQEKDKIIASNQRYKDETRSLKRTIDDISKEFSEEKQKMKEKILLLADEIE